MVNGLQSYKSFSGEHKNFHFAIENVQVYAHIHHQSCPVLQFIQDHNKKIWFKSIFIIKHHLLEIICLTNDLIHRKWQFFSTKTLVTLQPIDRFLKFQCLLVPIFKHNLLKIWEAGYEVQFSVRRQKFKKSRPEWNAVNSTMPRLSEGMRASVHMVKAPCGAFTICLSDQHLDRNI